MLFCVGSSFYTNYLPPINALWMKLLFKSKDAGWDVEFEIGHDDDGKAKAMNVTAPGGGPCTGIRKKAKPAGQRNRKGPAKPAEPFWHESLDTGIKDRLKEKGIRTTSGTIDVALDDARVKLGTHGYASVAHADGIIGEGKFVCGGDGTATFTWEHCISYDEAGASWVSDAQKATLLPSTLSLSDGE